MIKFLINSIFLLTIAGNAYCQKVYHVSNSWTLGSGNDPIPDFISINQVSNFSDNSGFQPGDQILLKRGDVWENEVLNFQSSGSEENPIVISSYGSQADPLPIISGLYALETNWVIHDAQKNIWVANNGETVNHPGRLFIEENGTISEKLYGYKFDNLGSLTYSLHDPSVVFERDVFYHNGGGGKNENLEDILLDRLFFYFNPTDYPGVNSPNDLSIFSSTGFVHSLNGDQVRFNKSNNVIFENIEVRGGKKAIFLSGDIGNNIPINNVVIRNCKIGANSVYGVYLQYVSNATIEDNIFDSDYQIEYGVTPDDVLAGKGRNGHDTRGVLDAIFVTIGATDCKIQNNEFYRWPHAAVSFIAAHKNTFDENKTNVIASGINNNLIYGNKINGEGLTYSRAFGISGHPGVIQNNEISHNFIEKMTIQSQIAGEYSRVHHNIFKDISLSPIHTIFSADALHVAITNQQDQTVNGIDIVDSYVSANNLYYNNLFINVSGAGIAFENIWESAYDNHSHLVFNNIFYNCGQGFSLPGAAINIQSEAYDSQTYTTLGDVENLSFQNNLFFDDSNTPYVRYRIDNTSISVHTFSIPEFNNASLLLGDEANGNIVQDPMFVNLNTGFELLSTSPCHQAGYSLPSILQGSDYYGSVFPSQNPDIGHQEIDAILTKVLDKYCGSTLDIRDGDIFAYTVMGSQNYNYKVIQINDPLVGPFYFNTNSSSTEMDLFGRSWVGANTTYQIGVRATRADGSLYSLGETCEVTTPHLTFLLDDHCGMKIPNDGILNCYPVLGATGYTFRAKNLATGNFYYYNTNSGNDRSMNMAERSWFDPSETFEVEVRATKPDGSSYSYGKPCLVLPNIIFQSRGFGTIDERNLANLVDSDGFTLYPNPTINEVRISSVEAIKAWSVTDVQGKIHLQKYEPVAVDKLAIDLSVLSPGTYFIRIQTDSGVEAQRLVVK